MRIGEGKQPYLPSQTLLIKIGACHFYPNFFGFVGSRHNATIVITQYYHGFTLEVWFE